MIASARRGHPPSARSGHHLSVLVDRPPREERGVDRSESVMTTPDRKASGLLGEYGEGCVVIPPALALAEARGLPRTEVMAAAVAAYNVLAPSAPDVTDCRERYRCW